MIFLSDYDFLIVGSGLFGATFASKAQQKGKKCLVIDRREHIGGNIYSQIIEGIDVHMYGPHIFHTNNEKVWEYMNFFTKFNHFRCEPIAKYKGKLYNLPFNMNTFYQMWGCITPSEAAEIINKQRREIKEEPKNLEEQAISLVGRDIYEALIKGYTEKQWGRECTELPASIITRLPVRFNYDNNYFNHSFQGVPIGGYTKMVSNMLSGATVVLSEDYLLKKEYWDQKANIVIYTGALDAYFNFCYGKLEYRSLRFEHEIVNTVNYQGVSNMNYTDKDIPYTRIVEHKHFEFGEQSKTVITKEYPQKFNDDVDPYYPVNDNTNNLLSQKYSHLVEHEKNIFFGGRLAEYKYYDMDQVVLSAINLAKKLM